MSDKTYYELLEVDANFSDEELKRNYRRLARQYHPDLNPDNESAAAMFRDIAEAYDVLSDQLKRKGYDLYLRTRELGIETGTFPQYWERQFGNPLGGIFSTGRKGESGINLGNLFNSDVLRDIFTAPSASSTEGGTPPKSPDESFAQFAEGLFGSRSPFFTTPLRKQVTEISMPENDWGLLAGVVMLQKMEGDGYCDVRVAPSDKRKWMKDQIVYRIDKQQGNLQVSRTLKDWRTFSSERNKEYKITEPYSIKTKETRPANTLFPERQLRVTVGSTISGVFIPLNFGDYLDAIKSLGIKIATQQQGKSIEVGREVEIINNYGRFAHNTNQEGSIVSNPDYEMVRRVPFPSEFWNTLQEAERSVTLYPLTGKEGQIPGYPEEGKPGKER